MLRRTLCSLHADGTLSQSALEDQGTGHWALWWSKWTLQPVLSLDTSFWSKTAWDLWLHYDSSSLHGGHCWEIQTWGLWRNAFTSCKMSWYFRLVMKTKLLTPQSIIDRLNDIREWINKNGFSNRGRVSVSDDIYSLEKALEIVCTASETLKSWERAYQKFYLEKTVEDHPEFAKKWANQWERVRCNWDDPEYLYNMAVKYNSK